jgi:hypothetical protein
MSTSTEGQRSLCIKIDVIKPTGVNKIDVTKPTGVQGENMHLNLFTRP